MKLIEVNHNNNTIIFSCNSQNDFDSLIDLFADNSIETTTIQGNAKFVIISDEHRNRLGKIFLKFGNSNVKLSRSYREWKAKITPIIVESGVVTSKIISAIDGFIEDKISDAMSFFLIAAIQSEAYKSGRWDGKKRLYSKRTKSFPSGLLFILEDVLFKNGFNKPQIEYTYDRFPKREFNWKPIHLFDPSKDQLEAIEKAKVNPRGVIKASTGFGKTSCLARYLIADLGVPTLFIANKKQLLDDAEADFANGIKGIKAKDIGKIKDGSFCDSNLLKGIICPIKHPIVVATIQSISARLNDPRTKKEMKDWLNNVCKLVIVDESQALGTEQWDEVMNEIMAPYRFALSATPKRTDGATLKIYACSGPIIYETTAEEQIKAGRLCDLDIFYQKFDHQLYNEMDTGIEYNELYTDEIVNNERRNMECVIAPTLEMLEEERVVLILIQRIDHGDVIKNLLIKNGINEEDVEFVYGGTKDIVRKDKVKEFRAGNIKVLIGSTIFDAGVDVPIISGIVLAGAGNSEITLVQRIGRGARTFDYKKRLGYIPKFMEGQEFKITKVYDVIDLNVKFFKTQSRKRMITARDEFGKSRVHTVETGSYKEQKQSKKRVNYKELMEQAEQARKEFLESQGDKSDG